MTTLVQAVNPAMRMAFVDCHADGHQWRHEGIVGAPDWMPPFGMVGAIARHSICTSCGMERARWYTRSGEVVNRYKPVDGYYHKRETPDDYAPTRQEWRQQLVVTLFAQIEAAETKSTKSTKRRRAS